MNNKDNNHPTPTVGSNLHPTELRCPNQCGAFREIIDKMYRTHLEKNQDYSPANIRAMGELGLSTRVWDKVARLLNLMGFDIERGTYSSKKEPKNESIDDTLLDLANYAIIWQIYRQNKWGK